MNQLNVEMCCEQAGSPRSTVGGSGRSGGAGRGTHQDLTTGQRSMGQRRLPVGSKSPSVSSQSEPTYADGMEPYSTLSGRPTIQ